MFGSSALSQASVGEAYASTVLLDPEGSVDAVFPISAVAEGIHPYFGSVYSFLRFTASGRDIQFITTAADPYWPDVVLALHMNGVNAATTFQDEVGAAVTVNGNAQISTAQSKFNGSSGFFDGAGDFLSRATTADFGFGTGAWTAECWLYSTKSSWSASASSLIDFRATTGNGLIYIQTDGTLGYWNDSINYACTTSLSLNAWHHVAASYDGATFRLFVNGALENTVAASFDFTGSRPIRVGGSVNNNDFFQGYLTDVRVTKGAARYTSSFTPATEAFPTTDVEVISIDPTSQFVAGAVLNEPIPITGVATGIGHVQGTVAASPYFSAAVNAIVGAFGDVVASDIFYAIADGIVQVQGEASGAISFVGDAVGSIPPVGRATGAMRFTGSGSGARGATGQVNTPIQFTSDTVGQHGRVGAVSGLMRFTGQASGARGVNGAGIGTIEFNALAEGHADVFPIGNVYALIGIGAQAFGPPAQAEICT